MTYKVIQADAVVKEGLPAMEALKEASAKLAKLKALGVAA